MTIQVFLYGRDGHMGRAIEAQIDARDDMAVCGGMSAGEPLVIPEKIDVVIDFSVAAAAPHALEFARTHKLPLVVGTTGMDATYDQAFEAASKEIPVLYASNMSFGVNVLRHLVQRAAELLPDDWNAEIVELHHNRKVDSPSGTAIALLESTNAGRGRAPREGMVAARDGIVGARTEEEIGVFGVRGGNVAGEHTVYFFGEDERVELTHRANSRTIFAQGAVRCAKWLADKPIGSYGIEDVLGL